MEATYLWFKQKYDNVDVDVICFASMTKISWRYFMGFVKKFGLCC